MHFSFRLIVLPFLLVVCFTLTSIAQNIPPIFSLSPGFYTTEQTLTISHPRAGITIHYTLDGSTPTTSSAVYTGAISITDRTPQPEIAALVPTNTLQANHPYRENWRPPHGSIFKGTVVRAIASDGSGWTSPVNTSTFFVHPSGSDRYTLPVFSISVDFEHFFSDETGIYVEGSHGGTPNFSQRGEDWERPIHIEFFEANGNRAFSHGAGARIHGGTSRNRPIKSLRLYARSDYGQSWFEYPFFSTKPVNRHKRILLRNSGNDWSETMLRDAFMQQLLVGTTELDIQHAQPAVVFINGEFWGIKNIRDRFDERYLQAHYDIATHQATFLEPVGNDYFAVARDNPEGREHFAELYSLLSVLSSTMNNARIAQLGEMMDFDNFIDYQAAQTYFRNTDWPGNNALFWRYNYAHEDTLRRGAMPRTTNVRDGRWRWMVFDTDFGFGLNFDYVEGSGNNFGQRNHGGNNARHNTIAFAMEPQFTGWPNPRGSTYLFRALLANINFRRNFANRYADLLNTAFRSEHVIAQLDSIASMYRPHMEEHIRRWNEPSGIQVWEQELNRMRSFASERENAIREHLRSELNLGDIHTLRLDVPAKNAGTVKVNSIVLNGNTAGVHKNAIFPWDGRYFGSVPVRLEAMPAEGYRFLRWESEQDLGSVDLDSPVIAVALREATSVTAVFASTVSTDERALALPGQLQLHPVSPNPFNPGTTIRFDIPQTGRAQLQVYSADGRLVQSLFDGILHAGEHRMYFDASALSSGMYIVRLLDARGVAVSRTVTLIK
ncbi:MAG: CotH kinase family protein [Bacteroidetes bacterium]|nr:CotH kinase family protein [Bacteroidota bacterium]MCH8523142.1 CotH kinase family protein [Balneolales bacterium]